MTASWLDQDIQDIVHSLGHHAQAFAGRSLLLTGASGFLGRYFLAVFDALNTSVLSVPCQVTAIDNFRTSQKKSLRRLGEPSWLRMMERDVSSAWETSDRFDYIVHAAGIASPEYYQAFPLETIDVAINGTRQMLELAKKHRSRMLFFSSSEIYGDPPAAMIPTPESFYGHVSCLGPRACYDESKRLGETLCRIYFTHFGVSASIVRPFNVYGPGMHPRDYRVLPNFAKSLVSGSPIHVYGHGSQTRTFCYITDAMTGFLKALLIGAGGEPYNIGTPTPEISIWELAKTFGQLSGGRVPVMLHGYPDSYPSEEPQRRCPDISKATRDLGYEPKVDLTSGLSRFIDWAQTAYPELLLESASQDSHRTRGHRSLGDAAAPNHLPTSSI